MYIKERLRTECLSYESLSYSFTDINFEKCLVDVQRNYERWKQYWPSAAASLNFSFMIFLLE